MSLSGLVAGWRALAGPIRMLSFPLALSGKVTAPTQLRTVCSAPGHHDVGGNPEPQCPQPEVANIQSATTV